MVSLSSLNNRENNPILQSNMLNTNYEEVYNEWCNELLRVNCY